MAKEKVQVLLFFLMEAFIMENLKMTKPTDSASYNMLMAICMKVNGKINRLMVMDSTNKVKVQYTKEIG